MTRNIYGLLVGIDEYVTPVNPLKGCVSDIQAVKEYLEGRVATDGYQLFGNVNFFEGRLQVRNKSVVLRFELS
jgi:hypothetical protein